MFYENSRLIYHSNGAAAGRWRRRRRQRPWLPQSTVHHCGDMHVSLFCCSLVLYATRDGSRCRALALWSQPPKSLLEIVAMDVLFRVYRRGWRNFSPSRFPPPALLHPLRAAGAQHDASSAGDTSDSRRAAVRLASKLLLVNTGGGVIINSQIQR